MLNDWKWMRERKQQFKEHAVPIFRIEHSRLIDIKGEAYQLIGQKTTDSPIFTNYHVIDTIGNRAPEKISEEVYTYITQIELLTEIIFLRDTIHKQTDALNNERSQYVLQHYKKETGKDLESIFAENKALVKLLKDANKELSMVNKQKDAWNVQQLQKLADYWERVRRIYEKRMTHLQNFFQFIQEEELTEESLPKGLNHIYGEANEVMRFFYGALQMDPSKIKSMNLFISINGKLGQVEETKEEQKVLTGLEKFSHLFFSRILYMLIFLLSLYIWWEFNFTLLPNIGIGYLFLMSGVAHFLRNATLKRKMNTQIATMRTKRGREEENISQLLMKAYEVRDESAIAHQSLAQRLFRQSHIWSIGLMVIGAGISIYIALTYQSPLDWVLILFGLVIIAVGWALPRLSSLIDILKRNQ